MKKLLLISLATAASSVVFGQYSEFDNSAGRTFTISGDDNSLQIGGRTSGYYQARTLKAGETNKSHNGWELKDMDFDILGHAGHGSKKFIYEFQVSFVDIVTAATSQNTAAPLSPGIKAAYLQYVGCPVNIKLGYDKLPFSLGNIADVWATPFWSHGKLTGGDLWSRRDWGLTLDYSTWASKLNFYAGAYSGMGETFFEYGNDQSGKMEYAARVEFSFPGRVKYRTIDEEASPKPQILVGLNARYFDKTQPSAAKSAGAGFAATYPDAVGPYGISVFDGKRTIMGADLLAKYKGLSFTFEADMVKMQPTSQADPIYQGTPESKNAKVVNAGGITTSLNYDYEKWHSVLSVQYDNLNVNDLVPGTQQWVAFAYAYKVTGFNSVFKIEYVIPTLEDKISNPVKYTNELRVGYQIVF